MYYMIFYIILQINCSIDCLHDMKYVFKAIELILIIHDIALELSEKQSHKLYFSYLI